MCTFLHTLIYVNYECVYNVSTMCTFYIPWFRTLSDRWVRIHCLRLTIVIAIRVQQDRVVFLRPLASPENIIPRGASSSPVFFPPTTLSPRLVGGRALYIRTLTKVGGLICVGLIGVCLICVGLIGVCLICVRLFRLPILLTGCFIAVRLLIVTNLLLSVLIDAFFHRYIRGWTLLTVGSRF